MHKINLLKLDFKLLVAPQVLLEERNVTRAAERIGLSQSAMSHVLSRLREVFDAQSDCDPGTAVLDKNLESCNQASVN